MKRTIGMTVDENIFVAFVDKISYLLYFHISYYKFFLNIFGESH